MFICSPSDVSIISFNVFVLFSFGDVTYWIGLSFNADEGKFKWCDKSYSPYRNWCAGEPQVDVATGKTCVAYVNEGVDNGCFKVQECGQPNFVLCVPKYCPAKSNIHAAVSIIRQQLTDSRNHCSSCGKH